MPRLVRKLVGAAIFACSGWLVINGSPSVQAAGAVLGSLVLYWARTRDLALFGVLQMLIGVAVLTGLARAMIHAGSAIDHAYQLGIIAVIALAGIFVIAKGAANLRS